MPYITIEEEVWVDLDDFETEDLVEELKRRKATTSVSNWTGPNGNELVNDIYLAKHVRHQPYEHLVDELIGTVLGKIV